MSSVVGAAVRAMRPRQWTKNLLVFGAPLAAGTLPHTGVLANTVAAFVAFCLCASGIYLVNDSLDVEEDRRHPTKKLRPIASGQLTVRVAWVLAVLLLALGIVLAFLITVHLGITLVAYAVLQLAYSLGLKHQPVVDIAFVASGFLLRAVGGGAASDIPLSRWFLLVAAFGSLFMVAGKRYSEIHVIGAGGGTRKSLEGYSESYLRFVWSLAAAVTITFYALWAYESVNARTPWAVISVAPFTMALLRYAVDIDRGMAGSPDELVLRDRTLQGIGIAWLLFVSLSVFGAPFPS